MEPIKQIKAVKIFFNFYFFTYLIIQLLFSVLAFFNQIKNTFFTLTFKKQKNRFLNVYELFKLPSFELFYF